MQEKVSIFNKNSGRENIPLAVADRLLDTQSELGELAKEYLKNTNYGKDKFKSSLDFELEYGDVMYSLLTLANETGLEAEKCLEKALEKYQLRMKNKNNMGSGR